MKRSLALAAFVCSVAQAQTLDRTSEPLPLIVGPGETLRLDKLTDNATNRPGVIVTGGTVEIGVGLRQPTGVHERATDPGIGTWFPGTKRDASKHDVARALIVAVGSFRVKVNSLTSDVGVLALAGDNGEYGVGSEILLGYSKCGFGVMLSGQKDYTVRVSTAVQLLYSDGPARHVCYLNESWLDTGVSRKYLRAIGGTVRIGSVTSKAMVPNPVLDSCTFKSKGAWFLDVEIRKDRNRCGSADLFESCGLLTVLDQQVPIGEGRNPVFCGLRLGDRSGFGPAPAFMAVRGSFDGRNDPLVPTVAVHCLDGRIASLGISVKGKVNVYGAAASLFPDVQEIVK